MNQNNDLAAKISKLSPDNNKRKVHHVIDNKKGTITTLSRKRKRLKLLELKKNLLDNENEEDEKDIKELARKLCIKGKRPAAFEADGLDYILDILDSKDGSISDKNDHGRRVVNECNTHEQAELEEKSSGSNDLKPKNKDHSNKSTILSDDNLEQEYNLDTSISTKNTIESNLSVNVKQSSTSEKYLPPERRFHSIGERDSERKIKRQLKGLLNKLSEDNLKVVCNGVKDIYQANSRAVINQMLSDLILSQLSVGDPIPERIISESVMLIVVLCSTIGIELLARILESACKKLHELFQLGDNGTGKQCNNVLQLVCSMYQFKSVQKQIVFDLVFLFIEVFAEKDMELLLVVFKSVGFQLRKDDPVLLKTVFEMIMKRAQSDNLHNSSRMKFMLDILTAVKNNNIHKISEYDNGLINNRRKKVKALCSSELDIFPDVSFKDLVEADEKGRWWIVGSAWKGTPMLSDQRKKSVNEGVSAHLVAAAHKLRMNTDIRRQIFYSLMSSEDFMDAFENINKIGLKGKQVREIGSVLVECCLQQKVYNPFYFHVINKFCRYNREFVMVVQCALWDRFKLLTGLSSRKVRNLTTLVSSLILSSAITFTCLKTIEFTAMNAQMVGFLREIVVQVSERAESLPQLDQLFRRAAKCAALLSGLKLFVAHFMLRDAGFMRDHAHVADRLDAANRTLMSLKPPRTI